MAETSGANHALIDYIDALLVEDAAASPAPAPQDGSLRLLCFAVAGVPLAILAEEVAEVREAAADPRPEDRIMGTFLYGGRTLILLDTRRLILPDKHPALAQPSRAGQVLILPRQGLALRCDRAVQTQTVTPDEVVWREQRPSRPWLAGMVRGRALLDPAILLESARGH